jgi:hypothetical protein
MRKWIVKFLGSSPSQHTQQTFSTTKAALELFFDDCHFSMDALSLKKCLTYSPDMETLEVIFRNSQKHYSVMSESARIGLGAETFTSCDSAAAYIAKVGLSIAALAVVQFPKPVGGFALHHVAEAFSESSDVEQWSQLGVDIIRNGADLFSVKMLMNGRPWWTPFTKMLRPTLFPQEGSPFSGIRRPLQRWNDMLRRANVDLEWYCAREFETWQTMDTGLAFWLHRSFTCTTRLVKLQFCHETQSCIPVFRDEFIIPVMRLRLIPGSFVGSQYPVETICWGFLSKEEEDEGHWSRVRTVVIRSSHTYDHDPNQGSFGWYNKLIDCTQDDNGTLLQITRSPRSSNRSSKRASSEPPSQYRTQRGEQTMSISRTHKWLPPYHYCHVRCTWTVSCHRRRLERWMDPFMSKEPRLCVYQKDNDDIGNYMDPFQGTNFLGEIRNCKSDRYRFGGSLHQILRHSHKTRCPRGCDQVDLEKLAKPRNLPHWHPCRNEL